MDNVLHPLHLVTPFSLLTLNSVKYGVVEHEIGVTAKSGFSCGNLFSSGFV